MLNDKYNSAFKLWELLDGIILDSRVGNYWTLQEVWSIYIRRRLEILYESEYGMSLTLVMDDIE